RARSGRREPLGIGNHRRFAFARRRPADVSLVSGRDRSSGLRKPLRRWIERQSSERRPSRTHKLASIYVALLIRVNSMHEQLANPWTSFNNNGNSPNVTKL